MSGLLAALLGDRTAPAGTHWLPGSVALVALGATLLLLVLREMGRGAQGEDGERRASAAVFVLVLPLVLCVAIAAGARFVEMVLA